MKKIKPKMYSLCCGGYDVMYRCGNCNRVFNIVDDDFSFCPKCGKPIDWGVLYRVNEEWKSKYLSSDEEKKKLMRYSVDSYNETIEDGMKYEMQVTDATKKAIIKSNIKYYIGNGWTKEELMRRGFFNEEDFEDLYRQ